MRLAKTNFSLPDIYFSIILFVVIFVGNATLGGLPLNLILPVILIMFASQIRATQRKVIFIIFSTLVFLTYATTLGIDYNPYYPLWVVSFVISYFITLVLNNRINCRPFETLKSMTFIYLFLLLIIFLVLINTNQDNRAFFVFGPNMLYRIIAFLSGIAFGYLFYTKRNFYAVVVLICCFYMMLKTGSRGINIVLPFLVLIAFHTFYKSFSLRNIFLIFALSTFLFFLLSGQFNFSAYRSFNFNAFDLDLQSSYMDTYIRYRPYFYLFFEPDRFSIIGINYQTWLDIFYIPGFAYPHSLILELILFYGIFGTFFAFYVLYKLITTIRYMLITEITPLHILYYSLIASGLGAFLSGDMGDNAAFLGTLLAMSSSEFKEKILNDQKTINHFK